MKLQTTIFFILLFLSFFLPFILQKSIFPFYRFGMFAEPVTTNSYEKFEVWASDNTNTHLFDAQTVGLYNSVFNYLLRNYYYRNQANEFLSILAKSNHTYSRLFMVRKYNTFNQVDSISIITDTIAILEIEPIEK